MKTAADGTSVCVKDADTYQVCGNGWFGTHASRQDSYDYQYSVCLWPSERSGTNGFCGGRNQTEARFCRECMSNCKTCYRDHDCRVCKNSKFLFNAGSLPNQLHAVVPNGGQGGQGATDLKPYLLHWNELDWKLGDGTSTNFMTYQGNGHNRDNSPKPPNDCISGCPPRYRASGTSGDGLYCKLCATSNPKIPFCSRCSTTTCHKCGWYKYYFDSNAGTWPSKTCNNGCPVGTTLIDGNPNAQWKWFLAFGDGSDGPDAGNFCQVRSCRNEEAWDSVNPKRIMSGKYCNDGTLKTVSNLNQTTPQVGSGGLNDCSVWSLSRPGGGANVDNFYPSDKHCSGAPQIFYERESVEWCTGAGCVQDAAAHPLEVDWGGQNFAAVRIADLDMEPHANAKTKSRSAPTMLEFGMPRITFAPECAEDLYPASGNFNLKKMSDWGKSLPHLNPCQDTGGGWSSLAANQKFDKPQREGSGSWKTFVGDKSIWGPLGLHLDGSVKQMYETYSNPRGIGVPAGDDQQWAGATYPYVAACWDRKQARMMMMRNANLFHDTAAFILDQVDTFVLSGCKFAPTIDMAPGTGGIALFSLNFAETTCHFIWYFIWMALCLTNKGLQRHGKYQRLNGEVHDCGIGTGSFKRSLCDLHCVRDAARATTSAVLEAVVNNFQILQTNLDGMMEFYTGQVKDKLAAMGDLVSGGSSSSSMLERIHALRSRGAAMFGEMKDLVQQNLEPGAHATISRSLDAFSDRWSGADSPLNNSRALDELSSHVTSLFRTIQTSSSEPISNAGRVAQKVLSAMEEAQQFARSQNQRFGKYRESARSAKKNQDKLSLMSLTSISSLTDDVRQLGANALIMDFDRSWWVIREKLDTYFDAAENQNAAFENAIEAAVDYTSKCTKTYHDLQVAQDQAARADDTARSRLSNAWFVAVHELGLLSSMMADTSALARLGRHDVLSAELQSNRTAICEGGARATGAARSVVSTALSAGLATQTWKQFQGVFVDLQLLKARFAAEDMDTPDTTSLKQAKDRALSASRELQRELENFALEVSARLCKPTTSRSTAQKNMEIQIASLDNEGEKLDGRLQELGTALKELAGKQF